jgi:hypothetical protein
MTALNQTTRRRLQKLPQIQSVWEGDRHPLSAGLRASIEWVAAESVSKNEGECILWVDGSQGMVRAMDVVTPDAGPEAVVRVLLRAMEYPHSPAKPARPQKIVVRDREIQFFLRGVLQDLDIVIDYVPELPLIDEILHSFQDVVSSRNPQLPPEYAEALRKKADEIWLDAPWELLSDHQILAIELNHWDIGTLYASVMGMLGMEYGILLYRSLDSLKRFRQRVLANESMEQLEEAFLEQDCLFLTFERAGNTEFDDDMTLEAHLSPADVQPVFGNLHPLEGPRSFLYDEEAIALLVTLEALHRFFRDHQTKLLDGEFSAITSRYRIATLGTEDKSKVGVKVETMPDLAAELLEMGDLDEESELPAIRDDLVPEDSFLSLGVIPWEMVGVLRQSANLHQPGNPIEAGDGLPVVLIQTSRPKAKSMIEDIQNSGGLQAICFNPGEDPLGSKHYDLGLFQTGNGDLCLFGEFVEDDPVHAAARKKWNQRCQKTKGYCGLVIAKGLKGSTRGNPQVKDMVALFETKSLSAEDLGLGTLELRLQVDWM